MRFSFLVLVCMVLGSSTALASRGDDDSRNGSRRGGDDRSGSRGSDDGSAGRGADDGAGGDDVDCLTVDDNGGVGGNDDSGHHDGYDDSGHHGGGKDGGRRNGNRVCVDPALRMGCSAGGGDLAVAPLLAVVALIGASLRLSRRNR